MHLFKSFAIIHIYIYIYIYTIVLKVIKQVLRTFLCDYGAKDRKIA